LFAAYAAGAIFSALTDDRARAGALAGALFVASYWADLGAALVALASGLACTAPRRALVAFLLLGGLAEIFALAPLMGRHGAGLVVSFALLHGAAGALHLLLALALLTLAWLALTASERPAVNPR
jgi:hypothetical protein